MKWGGGGGCREERRKGGGNRRGAQAVVSARVREAGLFLGKWTEDLPDEILTPSPTLALAPGIDLQQVWLQGRSGLALRAGAGHRGWGPPGAGAGGAGRAWGPASLRAGEHPRGRQVSVRWAWGTEPEPGGGRGEKKGGERKKGTKEREELSRGRNAGERRKSRKE